MASNGQPPPPIPFVDGSNWQREFELALREEDQNALFERVEVAEAQVRTRLDFLPSSAEHEVERACVEDALQRLLAIKRERLAFP